MEWKGRGKGCRGDLLQSSGVWNLALKASAMSIEIGSASFNLTVKSIWNVQGKEQSVPTQLLGISSGDNIQPLVISC